MQGFQRSLALTTHFVLNNEIITQATSLEGARILSQPPQEGSWKSTAIVLLGGVWAIGTAPKDTPLGHLVSSTYDYVVSQTLGIHVDYDESLGETLARHRAENELKSARESQLDSLIEKCEASIGQMHRPVAFSETAEKAIISYSPDTPIPIGPPLTLETWDFIHNTSQADIEETFECWVSSYNINTFKGRAYVSEFQRPIPFILADYARDISDIAMITTSLAVNAEQRLHNEGRRYVKGYRRTSSKGRVKGILVTAISKYP